MFFLIISVLYQIQLPFSKTIKMNVFIPFIESYIPSYKIEKTLEMQNFGKVTSIELHDKKIKQKNSDKNNLKSAKHNYAFLTIELFNTTQGNNMRNNLLYNKTTHLMFDHNQQVVHLQLKPHLSVEDRLERGFELHIPETQLVEKSEPNTPIVEKENDSVPEWFHNDSSSLFGFKFGAELPKQLSLLMPSIVETIQHVGEMAPRSNRSFYDNDIEKQMVESDYHELMDEIERERHSFRQHYSLLPI